MAKTADRLLDGVKRRAIVPASQPLFDDSDILAFADDVTEELLVPLVKSVREDYFITFDDSDLTVSGTSVYNIPYRSVARGLADLKLRSGTLVKDMTKVTIKDSNLYEMAGPNTPLAYYIRGDKIVFVPTPNSVWTIEKWYELEPGSLVKLDDAAIVTGFTDTTVTVSVAPDTITTGTVVDFIQSKSGNSTLAMDKTVSNAAGTTYTFTSGDIPTDLAVGDYVSVAETTPVIQLPNECYPLLETATTRRALAALGDFEGADVLMKAEDEETKRLLTILTPRVESQGTIIVNRRGLLRGSRSPYRRGFIY